MADLIFNKFPYHVSVGNIDLDNDTFKIALVKSSYTPDATDEVWSDISAHECDATGYVAGGKTLANVSVAEAAGVTTFDADDPDTWTTLTGTGILYAVIYDSSSSDRLCCLFQLSTTRNPSSENLALFFDADGILDMAEAA